MKIILLTTLFVSFVLTLIILPRWIKKCNQVGLLWEDMNKFGHPRNVASSGGIIVVMAFVIGVLSYIAIKTYYLGVDGLTVRIFALLSVILILAIVGLTDDLLGWKHGGLSVKFRLFLVLAASIPLAVINAGNHTINFPFLGLVDLSSLYPLILM